MIDTSKVDGLIRVGFWKTDGFARTKLGVDRDSWLTASIGASLSNLIQHAILYAIEDPFPSVFDCIDPQWNPKERDKVIAYISDPARRRDALFGSSTCRICGMDNGMADYSDGKFIWPEGLAHYLKDHAVRPPEEFVRYVLKKVA